MSIGSPQPGAIRCASGPMPWSLPRRRGDGAAHVQKHNPVGENRLLKLGADDFSRLQSNLNEADSPIVQRDVELQMERESA
jgi:hypothetical protein